MLRKIIVMLLAVLSGSIITVALAAPQGTPFILADESGEDVRVARAEIGSPTMDRVLVVYRSGTRVYGRLYDYDHDSGSFITYGERFTIFSGSGSTEYRQVGEVTWNGSHFIVTAKVYHPASYLARIAWALISPDGVVSYAVETADSWIDLDDSLIPAVAVNSGDGSFLIVFSGGIVSSGYDEGVVGIIVNADGTQHGGAFWISPHAGSGAYQMAVDATWDPENNRYFVVWSDRSHGSPRHIYGRIVSAGGDITPSDINNPFPIATTYSDAFAPSVVYNPAVSEFLVAFTLNGTTPGGEAVSWAPFYQRVNLDGSLAGGENPIALPKQGTHMWSYATTTDVVPWSGEMVLQWTSVREDFFEGPYDVYYHSLSGSPYSVIGNGFIAGPDEFSDGTTGGFDQVMMADGNFLSVFAAGGKIYGRRNRPSTADYTSPSLSLASESHNVQSGVWQNAVSDPRFVLSASDSKSGFEGYYIYWGTNSGGWPSVWQTNDIYDPGLVSSGTYYLRVRARDYGDNISSATTVFVFRYDGTRPSNPTSAQETHGVSDNTWQRDVNDPAFTWAGASDAHSGIAGYYVYFGTNPSGTSNTFVTSASYDPGPVSSGTYYLRVRAKDKAGNLATSWVTLFTFKYDGMRPSNPTSAQETHGVSDNTWQRDVNDPAFTWAGASDAHSGIAGYYVYFGTNPSGTSNTFVTSASYDPGPVSSGTYYLRVRAKDKAGNLATSWVTLFTFKYDSTKPYFDSIGENHDLDPGMCQATVSRPSFSWQAGDDHSGLDEVRVVSLLGDYHGDAEDSFTVEYSGSVSDTIEITAIDNVGWETPWRFTFCYIDPDDPGPGRPATPTVSVDWPDGDSVGGGCHLKKPVINVSGGGDVFGNGSFFKRYEGEIWFGGIGGQYVRLERRYLMPGDAWEPFMPYPGTYRVRIRAWAELPDGMEFASEWESVEFCIDDEAPPAPAPVRLCDLESGEWTNQECFAGNWGMVTDWPSGLDHYIFCFGPGFCAPTVTMTGTSTTWTAADINADGEYRLRVQAADAVGNVSGIAEFVYKLDRVAPLITETVAPPAVVSDVLEIAWDGSDERSGLAYYRIQFQSDEEVETHYASGPASGWTGSVPEGEYTVTVRAVDWAGNESLPLIWHVGVDLTPPEIGSGEVVWEPAWSASFTATVEATDTHGVSLYRWRAASGPQVISGETTKPIWVASLPVEGIYDVNVQVVDAVGNASDWRSIGMAIYDATPPDPEPPEAPSRPTNAPVLSFDDDPDVAWYRIAIEPGGETLTVTVPPSSYTLPLTTSGLYTVTVQACDAYGNCTGGWVYTILFDNEPPEVSIIAPEGWVSTPHLEYVVAITDNLDTDPLAWYCFGEGCNPDELLDGNLIAWDVDASGIYTVVVKAVDEAGNASFVAAAAACDLEPPEIEFLSTGAGDWQKGIRTPRFNWTASDVHSGLGGFEATVGGMTVTLPATVTSYIADPVPEDWEGEFTFRLRAYDRAEPVQWSGWSEAVFRYDGRSPVITVTSPIGEGWQNERSEVDVAVAAADGGSGVEEVRYCVGLGGCTPREPLPGDGLVTVSGESEEPVYLRVAAVDGVGNVVTSTVYVLRYDATPPRVELEVPSQISQAVVTPTVLVTDVAVAGVTLQVMAGNQVMDECDGLPCALTFPADGVYTIALEAEDEAGNTAVAGATVLCDTTPPIPIIQAPDKVSAAAGSFEVSWDTSEDASYIFLVNGEVVGSGQRAGSCDVAVSGVGEVTLTVVATDVVGNVGQAEAHVDVVADYERDGMDDLWEAANGLDWQEDDAGEDPDGDGLSNLEEFIFKFNPRTPTNPEGPEGVVNEVIFTFIDREVAGYRVSVEPTGQVFTITIPPMEHTLPLTTSGLYTVTVQACDAYGNCTGGWVYTILFDNEPPEVSIIAPEGWVSTPHLEYVVAITDNLDTDPLAWYCFGEGCNPDELLDGNLIAWDVDASGIYTVVVKAVDEAGNASFVAAAAACDLEPPEIELLSTNASDWQKDIRTPRFTWSAHDSHSGLGGFEAAAGGITVTLPATVTSHIADPVPEDWEGEFTFRLRAYDRAEPVQWSGWSEAVFRYDGRSPVITVTSPIGEGWQNERSEVDVAVAAADGGSGVEEVRYCVGLGGCTPREPLPGDGLVTVSGLSEEPVYLRVAAVDGVGNVVTDTVYTLRYDATPPRLTMYDVPEVTATAVITIKASVTDVAVADAYVELLQDGEAIDRCTETELDACVLCFAGEGKYTVRLIALDEAGNQTHLDARVTYDTSAPAVHLDAPERVSVAADTFAVSWTVEDAVGWRFLVDGEEEQNGTATSGSAVIEVVPVTVPVTGMMTLRVEAWDEAGNESFDEENVVIVADYDGDPERVAIHTPVGVKENVVIVADYDGDGIPDLWEEDHGLNWQSAEDAGMDNDSDGLTNLEEYLTGCCDPQDPDSDNDGLADGEEAITHNTEPCNPDTDGDGLDDGWEVRHGTDPLTPTSTNEQVAVEAIPEEQTVGVGQVAHITIAVYNLGETTLSAQVVAHFPGASSPDGNDAGWTVTTGQAHRQVSIAPGEGGIYELPLVYSTPGDNTVIMSVLEAMATVVVHVADESWLVLEKVEHPAEAHPGEQIIVLVRLRNVSDAPAPGTVMRVRFGEEVREYRRDLSGRELWEQEIISTVPSWLEFPDASNASVQVQVEAAQDYSGQVNVIGPRFDFDGRAEPMPLLELPGVITYTLRVENTGNRSGAMVARLAWPQGVEIEEIESADGDAWLEPDGVLVWQIADLPVGQNRYLVFRVILEDAGIYRPVLKLTPEWALGVSDISVVEAGKREWRVFLPLIMRGGER